MKETDIQQIQNLKDGECYVIPESDYGKAEIWRKNGHYFAFLIPYLGGTPNFLEAGRYDQIVEMVDNIYSFT